MKKTLSFLLLGLFCLCCSIPLQAAESNNPLLQFISGSTIYFPHIAVTTDGSQNPPWDTEIAIINAAGETADGTLSWYDGSGAELGHRAVSLAKFGRYQADVGRDFTDPDKIAYMIFSSKTIGIRGYTKFFRPGLMRATIAASIPRSNGIFSKLDDQGWNGIAFINTSDQPATVTLTAYDDSGKEKKLAIYSNGSKLDPKNLPVKPGAKEVWPVTSDTATYMVFTSDQPIVGFFLNGTGEMLDGLAAQ